MTQSSSKKSTVPAFIGIYSPDIGRSKSFSAGLGAVGNGALGGQGQNGNALVPTRSKDESPFSRGAMVRTIGVYTASGAEITTNNGTASPGAAAGSPKAAAAVRSARARVSTSEISVASEASSALPPASSLSMDGPGRSSRPAGQLGAPGSGATAGNGGSSSSSNRTGASPTREAWGPGARPGQPQPPTVQSADQTPSPFTSSPKAAAAAAAVGAATAGYGRKALGVGKGGPAAGRTGGFKALAGGLMRSGGGGGSEGAEEGAGGGEEEPEEDPTGGGGDAAAGGDGGDDSGEGAEAQDDEEGGGLTAARSKQLSEMLGLGGRSRSGVLGPADSDLPRLGVRFPGHVTQSQAAAGSPLKQRASEATSRSSSFTAGSAGGLPAALRSGSSFTTGKAPGGSNLYRVKWLDFGLTPEQALAKSAAERVARLALAKHAAKADENRAFPREAVAAAGKEGFGGVAVPTAAGGMGLAANDAAMVFEALGMGDTSVAGYLTIHNMVAWLVAHHATPAMQQQVLRNLASTALLAAYAATEPASGSDPAAVATTASPAPGGGFTLNGSKALVAGAAVADLLLVLARTGDSPTKGLTLFLVNKTSAGLSVGRPERSLGWRCVSLAPVTFQNCVVRADAVVGREGQGLELLNAALDLQRVWLAAVSVGGAQLALDYAISHGKGRKQGTKAITDMQAVQFRMVDLHAELQAARLMVRSAAQQMDAKAPTRAMSAAMAKQFATDTAATVAAEVCSLMGGAGMVGDHPPERIARDLRAHTVVGGSNEQLVGRVYGEMQKQAGAA